MSAVLAHDEMLRQHAALLTVLAERHGLTDLALGAAPGELVATVGPARTYFDVVGFELDAEDVVGAEIRVTAAGAAGARARAPLDRSSAT